MIALQARIQGGNQIGYAIAMELIEPYEKPGRNGEKEYLQVLVFNNLSTVASDSVNGDIQDSVAHLNNGHFEKFRSAWP